MNNKTLSSYSEFDARKLSFVTNRIQIFYLDKEGIIKNTCQGIWKIDQSQEVNFFDLFEALQVHKEAINFLFTKSQNNSNGNETINSNKEKKRLSINNLNLIFKEEIFFVDILFTIEKNIDKSSIPFLECLIEDKTNYYTSLNELEQNNELQEIEFLNEKWQLNKESELLEISHQKELVALNEQLRLNWTNLLVDNLKRIVTENFIQSNLNSESKTNFEYLLSLSNSFEKISGIRLFPQQTLSFLSDKHKFAYLGKNKIHQNLIQKLVKLAGGDFVEVEINQSSETTKELDVATQQIDFFFIDQNSIDKKINKSKEELISFCLLVKPTFLEREQHLIKNKTNLLIYPLYPFQIWQQLLSFTNTNIMSYNEQIDLSQIYEIVDNEPVLVQSMLQILDKNLREYPAQLQQEFNDGQLDTLRQTIHKFKSCTAYTGLTEFNTTLSEIEASQENGWTIAQIKDKLEFVLQAIPVIKVQVEEKLKELEEEIS